MGASIAEVAMVSLGRRPFLLALIATALAPSGSPRAAVRWVVSPAEAAALIRDGALVLDARSARLRAWDPVPGALAASPALLAEPEPPDAGRLLADDAELTVRLQALGVRAATPVVVLGDPTRGWAEDGRLVWSLRALGHDGAVLVDGGLPALRAAGMPQIAPPARPGDFIVSRRPDLVAGRDELRGLLDGGGAVVLDVRDPREFAGAVDYGETRRGHLPGARPLHWRDLLADDGSLLPPDALRARLAATGIDGRTEVIAYCTGGVRSGWMTVVLNDLGIPARNYAGSIWEWSAGDPQRYPLVTPD